MPLIAAGVVVVLIAGYFGLAAGAKLPPFAKASTPTPIAEITPTPTVHPTAHPTATPTGHSTSTASPTASSSLTPFAQLLPSYITGNSSDSCSGQPSSAYVATGQSGEELCDLSANSSAPEDYVFYAGFPTETPASAYFASLISSNGMQSNQGDCSSLSLVTASDGSSQYCEGTYTTSHSSGVDFVWSGSASFDLGNTNPISSLSLCTGVDTVSLVGFTDPTYAGVGVAIGCSGYSGEDGDINSDFTAGDFFLGS